MELKNSNHLRKTKPAWIAWSAIVICSLGGVAGLACGAYRAMSKAHVESADTSAAMYTLMDTEDVLESDINRTVQPAMKRTELLAAEPDLVAAVISGNSNAQTDLLNAKITSATEIDAIALFGDDGLITAINTRYSNGQPISAERVKRVLGADFGHRNIIQGCLRNNSTSSLLEFQTHCDITPAFFDSTGLSVAYSVPVINPTTKQRVGVLSSRLRFERLSGLIKERTISGGSAKAYFVTDTGKYFSEAINSGKEIPPVPTAELSGIVRPLLTNASLKQVTKRADKYLAMSSLPGVQTLEGGGIHILIVADGEWLTQASRQAKLVEAGGEGILGALLLTVAGLVFGGQAAKRSRAALEQASEINARLAAIVESSTQGIFSQELDGTIRTWNAGAEKIFGYSAEAAVGSSEELLETAERKGEMAKMRRDALSGVSTDSVETQSKRSDGQTIDTLFSISAIKNLAGETTGVSWIVRDITAEKLLQQKLSAAKDELESAQAKLLDAARKAGMAEVATGVLHNVGNVLNSVNVSAAVIAETVKKLRVASLAKIAELLNANLADLGNFMTNDNRGKALPGFLTQLSTHLSTEQAIAIKESDHLQRNIEHIKQIVSTQQAYASSKGIIEALDLRDLLDSSLQMHTASLNRHDIKTVRDLKEIPLVMADKHKVLQILVNLISNARHAMQESPEKTLTLSIFPTNAGTVCIAVRDSGCGIAPENLNRVFNHGFTTKADGHGFGLHSSALAAKEMKGSLSLHSDGPGCGAVFTLELPVAESMKLAA